ncbi:hypothetical protein BOTBODRAFT_180204 [Botryobasidium botryosum FD-172 SS1]|uniref:F-box domain-containing protein n=1 Tax=Botryobasidium botryosum (strain FD-172 SS1) TaxID=930990 RepID=A0A067LXE4_BOTB1|nr:hypothetical protein BOTBODRAFT_180204 [Botryobasidium botryosum FD-172 SS1]
MADPASDLIARLLRTIYQPIPRDGATSGLNTASDHGEIGFRKLDAEYEALEHARDLAIAAITSYSEGRLSANRSRRNQLCPIYRLPNEILASIFEYALGRRHFWRGPSYLQPLDTKAPWHVSRTSKLWREIALGTATLWSNIDLSTVPMTRALLERSKSALLDVQVRERGGAWDVRLLQILRPHINRCSALTLHGLTREALECLTTPAPRLEAFSAYVDLDSTEDVVSESSSALPDLFGGHVSQLRTMTLRGICLPLTSALFVGLTDLHLANISYVGSSMAQFFRNLAMCPLLGTLRMDFVKFSLAVNPVAPIDLRHLYTLDLSYIPREVIRSLLASIRTPHLLSLEIHTRDIPSFHSILPSSTELVTDLLNLSLVRKLGLRATNEEVIFVASDSDTQRPLFVVQFENYDHSQNLARPTLSELGRILSFPNIEVFDLNYLCDSDESGITPPEFAHIVRGMPTITSLELTGCDGRFMETLVVTPTQHLCPRLEVLTIRSCSVDGGLLVQLIGSRTSRLREGPEGEGGIGLRLVEIVACKGVGSEVIKALDDLPISVTVWDGSE